MDEDWFLFIFLLAIIFIYLLSYLYKNYYMTKVKSNIDNRTYYVRKLENADKAADLLATINKKILELINALDKDDKKYLPLIEGYIPENLRETYFNDDYKAYSVNKGNQLAICIRYKDNSFIDINTIFFVTVHELSHIMTEEYGHTKTFWNNMKDLLKISIKNNLYNPIDYSESPVNYCEMDINSTPLDKGDL